MSEERADENGPEQLGPSLVETLKRSELTSLAVDLGEVPLDLLATPGLVRDTPVLGSLVALWNTGKTVRDYLFTKKVVAFLRSLADVPAERRRDMVSRLERDPRFGREVGEEVVLLLDRLDAMAKATLVGRAFRAYCLRFIDISTLQRLNHAIDRILVHDLRRLPEFVAIARLMDGVMKQAFVNAGLAYVPVGTASTEIEPNRGLCDVMMRHVLQTKLDGAD